MSEAKTTSTGEYLPPKERYALGALPMTGLFAVVSTALGLGLNRSGVESKLAASLPSLNGWGGPGLLVVASVCFSSSLGLPFSQTRDSSINSLPAL